LEQALRLVGLELEGLGVVQVTAYCEVCGVQLSHPRYRRCRAHFAAQRNKTVRRFSPPPTPQQTPCRIWQGAVDVDGYGSAYGKRLHRWVIEQIDGPIADGLVVMHLCDNPPCYRYDHLKVGTNLDNVRDRHAKGRTAVAQETPHWLQKSGEEHTQAKLTWQQVYEIRARLAAGEIGRRLANEFGVTPGTITNIKKHKVWRSEEAS
jgi:hypothetical protein